MFIENLNSYPIYPIDVSNFLGEQVGNCCLLIVSHFCVSF